MISLSLAPGSLYFFIFIIYFSTFILLNVYYWFLFLRFVLFKEKTGLIEKQGLSVVLCARNEYLDLKENLPSILEQDYPDFEVIVVNYSSDDDSSILLMNMADQYPNLKSIEIKENLNFFSGKKFPLSIGIKSAKNDLIIVTNANCRPLSRKWLSLMASDFSGSTEVVLGYGPYQKQNGFVNKLIRYETVQKTIQYFSYTLAGIPYMGIGRNMAYRKSLFFRNKGFISHYQLNSGDDDLYINKVATKLNTKIIADPDSFLISEPKNSLRGWMDEKKKQILTPWYYHFKHQLLLGTYHFSVVFFYLTFILLLILNFNITLVLLLFSIRLAIQMIIFYRCMIRLREKELIWFLPAFEIFLLFINFALFISSLFSKANKWK